MSALAGKLDTTSFDGFEAKVQLFNINSCMENIKKDGRPRPNERGKRKNIEMLIAHVSKNFYADDFIHYLRSRRGEHLGLLQTQLARANQLPKLSPSRRNRGRNFTFVIFVDHLFFCF